MSFGGSVADMISRSKQNAALRRSRREIYQNKLDNLSNKKRHIPNREIIELSEDEKHQLDIKIAKALKRSKFVNQVLPIYIFSFIFISVIIIVFMIIKYL